MSGTEAVVDQLKLVDEERFITSVSKVKELKGSHCHCNKELMFQHKSRGATITLQWECEAGHKGQWSSSEVVVRKGGQDVFSNDILWCACCFLSGNNYTKLQLMGKFLNMAMPDKSTFSRYMNFYFCPEVTAIWKDMQDLVFKAFKDHDNCICGDGRCDSPGFCARYMTYVIMEQSLNVVLDIQVMDCRETGGVSVVMEERCFRKCIQSVCEKLKVSI